MPAQLVRWWARNEVKSQREPATSAEARYGHAGIVHAEASHRTLASGAFLLPSLRAASPHRPPGSLTAGERAAVSPHPPSRQPLPSPPPPVPDPRGSPDLDRYFRVPRAFMASSSDEQPKPPEPPAAAAAAGAAVTAVTAAPQSHAEWMASMQAYYAAAGHPYAWPAQVKVLFTLRASAPAPAGSDLVCFRSVLGCST